MRIIKNGGESFKERAVKMKVFLMGLVIVIYPQKNSLSQSYRKNGMEMTSRVA
jgi:hypothetical protein